MDEIGGQVKTEQESIDSKPAFTAVTISEEYERSQLPDLLRVYYTWLFPYDKYFQWLQYGSSESTIHS